MIVDFYEQSLRIEYEGGLHHLLSRGNERCDIFVREHDRQRFLDTIEEISQRFEIDVFAYVLMSKHYHLLIRTRRVNLNKAMHWFGTTYTQRFNRRHFEDLRQGLVVGSSQFAEKIHKKYLPSKLDAAMPQQSQLAICLGSATQRSVTQQV